MHGIGHGDIGKSGHRVGADPGAGLSTGIGTAVAYFIRLPEVVYLSFSLGLWAGVMIYVSFVELLPSAVTRWASSGRAVLLHRDRIDRRRRCAGARVGDPHNYEGLEKPGVPQRGPPPDAGRTMTALAIGIHNFPEGLATFASALNDLHVGIFIAIAIAIHNIPEGIAVSVPIYYATGNRNEAFLYSFLSGLSEPVGALIGYLLLRPFLTPAVLAGTLALVAGIMIYISLDELLPMAHRYGHGHLVISGVILGMLIMAISLIML